jgi:hypothetical protein
MAQTSGGALNSGRGPSFFDSYTYIDRTRLAEVNRRLRDIYAMFKLKLRGDPLVYAITACCCQGFLLLGEWPSPTILAEH